MLRIAILAGTTIAIAIGGILLASESAVPQIPAAAVGPAGRVPLASETAPRWRTAVAAANELVLRTGVAGVLGPRRVRLVFPDGGWVEFQPSALAMSANAVPHIVAIQFGRRS